MDPYLLATIIILASSLVFMRCVSKALLLRRPSDSSFVCYILQVVSFVPMKDMKGDCGARTTRLVGDFRQWARSRDRR